MTEALPVPGELKKALDGRPAARAAWEKLPPSHKNEYVRWITEANKPELRMKRVGQTVAKLTG